MRVATAAVPPFMKNGFLVSCEETNEAVLIDPGDEVDELLEVVQSSGADVQAILLTHAHIDHITGVARAKAALDVPVWLHQADLPLYDHGGGTGPDVRAPSGPPAADRRVLRARRALHIRPPRRGRAPHARALPGRRVSGHWSRQDQRGELFVGDTLFAGSNRPHGSTRRESRRAPAIDSERALQVPGRDDRLSRPRARYDYRQRAADESVSDVRENRFRRGGGRSPPHRSADQPGVESGFGPMWVTDGPRRPQA